MSHDPYVVTIDYTNWRGERSLRRIKPRQPDGVRYGANEWHREPQWLLRAIDVESGEEREFAMKDIHYWGKEGPPQAGGGLGEAVAALERMREALTPSSATKAAYMSEFSFSIDDGFEATREVVVPWTIIKHVMEVIMERASSKEEGQ